VSPPPVVVQLLGYPGTGKYTVAKALVVAMEEAGRTTRLLDNHASGNLILSLVPRPTHGIPDEVMDRIHGVRDHVLATLEQLTPRDWSVVFTNFPPNPERAKALDRHRLVAERRASAFVPVLLTCDPDEVLRRVASPERAERHKLVDPARLQAIMDAPVPLPPWDDIRQVDVTSRSPADAARAILDLLPL
jgi:hypothetical protein